MIPDGSGGTLASWFDNLAVTTNPADGDKITHFDSSGNANTFVVPLTRAWGVSGQDGQNLVLGENDMAFATDSAGVTAFDVNSGAALWQRTPAVGLAVTLLAANDPGGVSVLDWTDAPGSSDAQLLAVDGLDTSGAATENPVSSTIATAAYFDDNDLMAVNDTNQVLLAQSTGTALGLSLWNGISGGAPGTQRSADKVKITYSQVSSCSGFDNLSIPDRTDPTGHQNWLMVGLQAGGTQGTNTVNVRANENVDGQIDFISSSTANATASVGDLNKNKGVLTVTGIQPGNMTAIQAVNHNDHTQAYEKLHLDIKPRLDARKVFPFKVSQLNTNGSTALVPSNLPDIGALQQLLETIYGTQANVHFDVQPLASVSLNYDLNHNGILDGAGPEIAAVNLGLQNSLCTDPSSATCNAIESLLLPTYVKALPAGTVGFAAPSGINEYVQDSHKDTTEHVTGHEIGHSLGLNDVCGETATLQQCLKSNPKDTDRIMWHFDGTYTDGGCRLTKSEWDTINK